MPNPYQVGQHRQKVSITAASSFAISNPSPTTYYTWVTLGKVCPHVPISAPVEVGVTPRRTAVRTEGARVSETVRTVIGVW